MLRMREKEYFQKITQNTHRQYVLKQVNTKLADFHLLFLKSGKGYRVRFLIEHCIMVSFILYTFEIDEYVNTLTKKNS